MAVVCKFELISNPSIKFCVATTHLLYNPRRQDIRLAQVQILLAELDRIAKIPQTKGGEEEPNHYPIILSGDFNLQPYSAPYNLIVNGKNNRPRPSMFPLTSHLQAKSNTIICLRKR